MNYRTGSLEALYARFDVIADGREPTGDSMTAHRAILSRLASNQLRAEAEGWTEFLLTRMGGTGRVYFEATPPSRIGRAIVPDWSSVPDTPL
jgi:hypothetical protein